MKKAFYLPFLSVLFLIGCSSDDDITTTPEEPVDPIEGGEETSYYEIPESLADYYEEVDFSQEGEVLYDDLAVLTISKHTNQLSYGQRHNYLYDADEDPNNPDNVVLIYTGESRDEREYESGNNSHDPKTFNTEHVYPRSMLGDVAQADLHILRVADIEVNSLRYNYPFTDGEGRYELKGEAFYPGDEWRGDVARMIMYMNLRYDEPFEDMGGLDLFLEWNAEDPVSAIEIQRNTVIEGAQGNRNPFIDNPHLATRIWGGDEADNRWDGEAESEDTEAPTVPQDLTVTETGFETVSLSWEAASDNEGVAKYNVLVNGEFYAAVSSTNATVEDLAPGTTYSFTVSAADAAGNTSEESESIEGTTVADDEAPSVPANFTVDNIGATSATLSWDASTDNAQVAGYDIFINGEFYQTVTDTEYTIAGLTAETNYSFAVAGRDIYDNVSELSTAVAITTQEATDENTTAADIIISEYIESNHGNNKALEIGNPTDKTIDLSGYSLMKMTNGNEDDGWDNEYQLQGTLSPGEVFVLVHSGADRQGMIDAADELTSSYVMAFNGNDPIGLFKDGELIDMLGVTGGADFAKDVDLRRKSSIIQPNTTFTPDEWTEHGDQEFDNLGSL